MADTQATAARSDGPEGIGGWLALPVIVVVLTMASTILQLIEIPDLSEIANLFGPAERNVVIAQLAGNVLFGIIFPAVLLALLAGKKRRFPKFYIAWCVVYLVFVAANLYATHLVFGEVLEAAGVKLLNGEALTGLASAIIPVVVFVPYMLLSRRVRNTFVN